MMGFGVGGGQFEVGGWLKSPSFQRCHKSLAARQALRQFSYELVPFTQLCRIRAHSASPNFGGVQEAGTPAHQFGFGVGAAVGCCAGPGPVPKVLSASAVPPSIRSAITHPSTHRTVLAILPLAASALLTEDEPTIRASLFRLPTRQPSPT